MCAQPTAGACYCALVGLVSLVLGRAVAPDYFVGRRAWSAPRVGCAFDEQAAGFSVGSFFHRVAEGGRFQMSVHYTLKAIHLFSLCSLWR